jgi:hypothetical protein
MFGGSMFAEPMFGGVPGEATGRPGFGTLTDAPGSFGDLASVGASHGDLASTVGGFGRLRTAGGRSRSSLGALPGGGSSIGGMGDDS